MKPKASDTQRQARHLLSLANALLDGLTADTRAVSRCIWTLENIERAQPHDWTLKNLSEAQRTIAEVASRYVPNT